MGMRSNEMRPSNRVRSYQNSKPSLLQIIGVKRLVIILVVLVVFFASGFALLAWKDNKELVAQQEQAKQADIEDNYLNYMLSILDSCYGFSYTGTIENADFSYSDKYMMQQIGNLSHTYSISGVCKAEAITGDISCLKDDSSVYYTAFTSNQTGVYYDVSAYCETSVENYKTLKDRESLYENYLDHTYNISYPAGPFNSSYTLYDYIRGVLEVAKQDANTELAKSKTAKGVAQYSAKISSRCFEGENPIAPLFTNSESPVICSVYSLGGQSGERKYYIGLQQDDFTIQLTLTENISYSAPNPIYAVTEQQFLEAVQAIEEKIQSVADEKAKKNAEKNKETSSEQDNEDNTEESSVEASGDATEVAE